MYFRSIFGAEVEHDIENGVIDDTSHQLEALWSDGVYHSCTEREGGEGREMDI